MVERKRLVVDANILIRGCLGVPTWTSQTVELYLDS